MTERKALLLEIDAATRLGLLSFLRLRGYQCVVVSSAGQALDVLADTSFSFTLVDLNSNGSDAAELLQCLKLHAKNSGPIIAVADRRDRGLDGVLLDVETVLHKPPSLEELQQAIDALARPEPEALGPAPELMGGRMRREMELWRSPKMLEARRVLAATNQDLERAVAEGRFRADLYYRLNVIQVFVPPLRERVLEIPLLADYFVERYAKLYRRNGFAIPSSVMDRLMRHRYPGNVRELENLIKRMIVLDDPSLTKIPLPDDGVDSERSPSSAVEPSLQEIAWRASQGAEREAIAKMLERTGWNRVRAARALRISYRALLYKIKDARL